MFNFMSLRLRLTALSAACVGLVLAVVGIAFYFYFENSSYALLDAQLREQVAQIASTLNAGQLDSRQRVLLNLPGGRLDGPQQYAQVLDPDGNVVLFSSNLQQNATLPVSPTILRSVLDKRQAVLTSDMVKGTEMRLLYTPLTSDNTAVLAVIQAATPAAPVSRQLAQLLLVFVVTGVLALVLVSGGAWWTTGRVLQSARPVSVG